MSGKPAARLGDGTYMGGPIVQGSSGVMIGSPNGKACSTCPGGVAVGNPVNPMLGAKVLQNEVDLALSGDLGFLVSRSYSSYQTPTPAPVGIFGPGWQSQMSMRLTVTKEQVIVHDTAWRSLYFESLTEGGIGYSQSENLWMIRGGSKKLAIKDHSLSQLWESLPLDTRLDRNYYFVTNNLLGPVAILGYVSPYVPDDLSVLPQPLSSSRILIMEADRFGHIIRYKRYNEGALKGAIGQVIDGSGRTYRIEYQKLFSLNTNKAPKFGYGDDHGVRIRAVYLTHDPVYEVIPEEPLVSYEYSKKGELVGVYDRSGAYTRFFAYDDQYLGRMTGHSYAGRPVTNYDYNRDGKVIKQRNPQGLDYNFSYGPLATEVVDSLGRKERYEFEGEGGLKRLVKHVRKDGSIVRNEFDQHGRLVAQIDALNRKTEFELDISSGLLTKTITPDGREFKFSYNKLGQMTEMTAPNGQKSQTEFDQLGRMVAQSNGLGEKAHYHYEGTSDRLSRIEDALGKEKKVTWTRYGQIETFTDCSDKETSYRYDQWGNTIRVSHEEGLFERYQYDKKDRLIASDNTTNDITKYHYNSAHEVTKVILPDERERLIEYGAWGEVIAQQFGGMTQRFKYDPAGRLTELTNENGMNMTFEYDALDRLTKEVGFDGRTKVYRYDPLGRITDSQDVSIVSHYHYDEQDRLIERQLLQDEQHKTVHLQYGDIGLIQCHYEENNQRIGVRYRYDPLGRVIGESQWIKESDQTLWQYDINHQYNKLGLRESSELQGLPKYHYHTYGAGHFIGLILGNTALVDFERDNLHRETERRFGPLTLQQKYSERGDLTSVLSENSHYDLLNRHYQYDKVGQLLTTITNSGEFNYRYDLSGRLTAALSPTGARHYEYDAAGNIQPKGIGALYSVFDDNRVSEDETYHYHYDAFGNLIEKQHKHSMDIHRYRYDLEHRLTDHEYHNQEHKEYKQSHYQYDPFGRRLYKATEDQHYWYGWDENRLVTTETNDKRINTLYHPDSFAPLVRIEQDLPLTARVPKLGEVMEAEMGIKLPKLVTEQFNEVEEAIREDRLTDKQIQWLEGMMLTTADIKERLPKIPKQSPLLIHYYHCDHIGTPLALIRDTGEIDWKIEVDPFGKVISEQGADKLYQPIRMQGQQYDEESGLHYNRYRYYDPNVGRYISQDPIGLAGGMNNYIYPLNPNQMVDPLGLSATLPWWVVAAGGAAAADGPLPVGDAIGLGILAIGGISLLLTKNDTKTKTRDLICPPPPGDCKPDEYEKLNERVNNAKNAYGKLGKCRSGMQSYDLILRKDATLEQYQARSHRENKCFRGGDTGHQNQMADLLKNHYECKDLINKL